MTAIGLLVTVAAAEHGVGEVVQRPAVSEGPLIKSWPDAAVFEQLNGEPAMTLLRTRSSRPWGSIDIKVGHFAQKDATR